MNRALLRISLACLALFVLLLLNMNYVQAFETTKLARRDGQRPDLRSAVLLTSAARSLPTATARRQDRRVAPGQGHRHVPALLPVRQGLRPGHRLRHDLQPVRHRADREQPARTAPTRGLPCTT